MYVFHCLAGFCLLSTPQNNMLLDKSFRVEQLKNKVNVAKESKRQGFPVEMEPNSKLPIVLFSL
jgi:hypothetical protein